MNRIIFLLLISMVFIACNQPTAPRELNDRKHTAVDDPSSKISLQSPDWTKNAVFYALDFRQLGSEGSFKELQLQLPRIESLGVDVICVSPTYSTLPSTHGHARVALDYLSPQVDLGTVDDFKALVVEIHERGMKVLMDWDASAISTQHDWLDSKPESWYVHQENGIRAALLNFQEPALRKTMSSAMLYWLNETDIDGFRCLSSDKVGADFWLETRRILDKMKPVLMISDADLGAVQYSGIDAYIMSSWPSLMAEIASGKLISEELKDFITTESALADDKSQLLASLPAAWLGQGGQATFGNPRIEQLMALLSMTVCGTPMIYSGQEMGLERYHKNQKNLDWTELPLSGFYRRLIDIRHENTALWSGNYGGRNTQIIHENDEDRGLAFYRERDNESVLVLVNFSDEEIDLSINSEGHIDGYYEELFTGDEQDIEGQYTERLMPWGYRVYEIRF